MESIVATISEERRIPNKKGYKKRGKKK